MITLYWDDCPPSPLERLSQHLVMAIASEHLILATVKMVAVAIKSAAHSEVGLRLSQATQLESW